MTSNGRPEGLLRPPSLLSSLPSGPPLRRLLIGLSALVVFVLYFWRSSSSSSSSSLGGSGLGEWQTAEIAPDAHQIERMHLEAKQSHHALRSRQSSTWLEAKAEYIRRFHRDPPWAFSTWFQQAQMWKSQLIDDGFDGTVAQAEPYRDYFKHDCDQTEYSSYFLTEWRLIQMCFEKGQVSVAGYLEKWYVEALRFMVADFKDWAPKICVLINVEAEPRVLLPHEVVARTGAMAADANGEYKCPRLEFQTKRHQNVWPDVEAACGPAAASAPGPNPNVLQMTSNFTEMTDMCRVGRAFAHGGILSPDKMEMVDPSSHPVPILSSAKLSPFRDVLFPNPWRFTERPRWLDFEDVSWRDKALSIYWRGSTQGGYAEDSHWHFHRQNMVQHLHDYHRLSADVRFANASQCNDRACAEQQDQLPWGMPVPLKEAWKHMLVLDMDSNGPSERLYDFLRSGSAVARHSFLREWHDDRLVPWLHYAPLSADMDQVDESLQFLLSPEGEAVAHGIAEEGARAAQDLLRFEDMKLYFMRLVLELARDKKRI